MMRMGSGVDVHAFAEGAGPLVLGGVTVPDAPGLAGHSDADVVAHAVTDALLGATGRGDLGTRFGVGDPAVTDATSMDLLAEVVGEVAEEGWVVVNLDCTVLTERPWLSPFRKRMVANLSEVLGCGAVSVKFTTTDGLGFLGRGEGVACWAVCLLERAGWGPGGAEE